MRTGSLQRHVLSRIRRLIAEHIDATIDTAAREGQKIAPVRIVVVLLAAVLLAANIDERWAALWMIVGLSSEIASYRARLVLGRNPARPVRMRLIYLLTAASVSLAWSGMPLLYWINHVPGFEAVSVLILTAQLIHAQAFTYRSVPLLLIVGGIPSAMLLTLPWLEETLPSVQFFTIVFAALLAIGYVISSVNANRKTAQTLRTAQDELEYFAYFDALTSLANRRMFTEHLRRLITLSGRHGTRFTLLLIDLDRFKDINDTLGHDAGDALLVEISARLRRAVRADDQVARLGGDEFAVILQGADNADEIKRICIRIADSFAEEVRFNGKGMIASTSVGVAVFPDDGDQEEILYKSADIALYEAKRGGRNTWRYSAATCIGG
ncbi:GGDEF domain-containing protein [Sphingomonas sp. PB2P19]|uniref:GGDEF domain-containing protein n=1 Tax=Sphingomonas rhamnosi TaxID=3096156 RepID=UPI002FC6D357